MSLTPGGYFGYQKTTHLKTIFFNPKLIKDMKLYRHAGGKILVAMKLTIVLLLMGVLHAGAATFAQEVTLSAKSITLPQLFENIKQQTGYSFVYDRSILEISRPVAANYNKTPLKHVLDDCLRQQGLAYVLTNGVIIVKRPNAYHYNKGETMPAPDSSTLALIEIHGKVTNDKGDPLEGANVRVKGSTVATQTRDDGSFTIKAPNNGVLVVSFIGFESREVPVSDQAAITIQLRVNNHALSDIVVIGYGQQRKADLTSAAVTVKSEEFVTGPVTDAGELDRKSVV